MLRHLILILVFVLSWTALGEEVQLEAAAPSSSRLKASMGMGLLSRLDREVNPDFYEVHYVPELYGKLHRGRWGLIMEIGREKRESAASTMVISHESTAVNAWGRFDLDQKPNWAPFATAGVGAYFDQVTSRYGSAVDERNGRRGLFGLGAGITGSFLKVVELEFEGRVSFIQDRKDPQIAALFRLGYAIY